MSDIFSEGSATPELPFSDPNQVTLEDLVGEGKKYKTSEDLAKAVAHANNHIKQLEQDTATLKSELQQRVSVEDAIKQLTSKNEQPTNSEPAYQPPSEVPVQTESKPSASITLEDVKRLLQEDKQQTYAEQNLTKAINKVVEFAGGSENAKSFLASKANELGTSVARLRDLAQETPDAFLKLLDISGKQASTGSVPTYRPEKVDRAPDPNRLETKADFDELRRTNRSRYMSPEIQRKLMEVRLKELSNR